ncbi:MAG: hypothetical protein IJ779_05200 [Ruminococcus sp.]|nr:hypothetical protein [Ruminococcus sp.]
MNTDIIFTAVCAVVILIMIHYYSKRPNRLISAIFGTFSGIAAMLALCTFGSMAGIDTELNLFNLIGSAVLGVPYAACVIIMNFL